MRPFKFITFAIILTVFLPATSFALFVGPYTGKVLDSRTGETIKGASVLIYWEKSVPAPPSGGYSEPIKACLTYTDDLGQYKVTRQILNTGLIGWLENTTTIIYQPGYQAFINNRWQGDPPAFQQKGNIIKLERIPTGFDHKKHHERITNALRGLDNEFHDSMCYSVPFHKIVEHNQILTEMWEFQRRIEWEE